MTPSCLNHHPNAPETMMMTNDVHSIRTQTNTLIYEMDRVLVLSDTDPKKYRLWFEKSKAALGPYVSKFCFELYNAYYRHLTIDDVAKFPDRSLMSMFVSRSTSYKVAEEIRKIIQSISPPVYRDVSEEVEVREYLKGATSGADIRLMLKHALCVWTSHCIDFAEYEQSAVALNGVSSDALQPHAIRQYAMRCATSACMLMAFMALRHKGLTAMVPLIEQTTLVAMIYCVSRFCFKSLRIPGIDADSFEPTETEIAEAMSTVTAMLQRATKRDDDEDTIISRAVGGFADYAASASASSSAHD